MTFLLKLYWTMHVIISESLSLFPDIGVKCWEFRRMLRLGTPRSNKDAPTMSQILSTYRPFEEKILLLQMFFRSYVPDNGNKYFHNFISTIFWKVALMNSYNMARLLYWLLCSIPIFINLRNCMNTNLVWFYYLGLVRN